jgi:hypothetical protein
MKDMKTKKAMKGWFWTISDAGVPVRHGDTRHDWRSLNVFK